jgi:hypothetical protein
MGFRTGNFCTVWSVEPISDTNTKARISVSRKNKMTGEYETDFSGFVNFVGTAAASKALSLKERDRIKLGDVDVTTRYDKEKKVEYVNYKIFSFEQPDAENNNAAPTPQKKMSVLEEGEQGDGFPF